ncbi:unnamed protein product [Strongylus vulgaris]|uniref:Uncharacterized protein n=1 Tax=Strongylus vulgaris TaxID=40348 RepID=A0A3P7J6F5_STRVU|nr:unnamed protein product [Strongylus vulgaris]
MSRKAITSNPKTAKITQCAETLTNHAWAEEQRANGVTSDEALVTPKSRSNSESDEDTDRTVVLWGLTVS